MVLLLPALQHWLIELYDLSERDELLMVLPQVDGDMRPSMLLDKMRVLKSPGKLKQPTSIFWYVFLSRLPPDYSVHCVPFVGVEMLADVAWRADAQFRAWPRPAAPPQVYSVPEEHVEYGDEIIAARPSRTWLMPPRPGQRARLSSATTTPASAAAHSSAEAPAAGQRPSETPGAGIEEPPFLP